MATTFNYVLEEERELCAAVDKNCYVEDKSKASVYLGLGEVSFRVLVACTSLGSCGYTDRAEKGTGDTELWHRFLRYWDRRNVWEIVRIVKGWGIGR